MTACTLREQEEWKHRLDKPPHERQTQVSPGLQSSMAMDIKSLGTVFSKPGLFSPGNASNALTDPQGR